MVMIQAMAVMILKMAVDGPDDDPDDGDDGSDDGC